jgi:hypothetical protein
VVDVYLDSRTHLSGRRVPRWQAHLDADAHLSDRGAARWQV